LLIVYSFNKTKEGYKISHLKSAEIGALIIIVVALACVFAGISAIIDDSFHKRLPMYNSVIFDKHSTWNDPQNGLLGGEVTGVENSERFFLKDFKNKNWNVEKENLIIIPETFILKTGEKIKMIGRICNPCPVRTFIVNTIKPW
jgi:hypothetical protein